MLAALGPVGRDRPGGPGHRHSSSWPAAAAKGFVPKGRIDGLAFEASDLDVRVRPGPHRRPGPALALCATLCGRRAFLDQLSGEGVDRLAGRL